MRSGPSLALYDGVNREILGGDRYDAVAYGEDPYPQEGVSKGQFPEELFHERDVPRMAESVLHPAADPAVRVWGIS